MTEPSPDTGGRADLGAELRTSLDLQPLLVPALAFVLALVVGSIAILSIGGDPIEAYSALLRGMFGDGDRIAGSIGRSTPFIAASLSVAFAFRAGLFNIGVEGQLLVGAVTAAWLGTWSQLQDLPGPLLIPIVVLGGGFAGFCYGAIPGFLKARSGAHEVIVTIMLNGIAALGVGWLIGSLDPIVLRDPDASAPRTATISDNARLPELVDSSPTLHVGILVMIALTALVWFVLNRTTFGFEVRTVGANPHAARYAGMNVARTILLSMAIAGLLAGLAGAAEVSGTTGSLTSNSFINIGFDSIAIALLARANPWACIPAALLWGSMLAGAPLMQLEAELSIDVVRIVQALVLLFVAADVIVRTLFRLRDKHGAFEATSMASGWGGQ